MAWHPTAVLLQRIDAGESADGILATDAAVDALQSKDLIVSASRTALVQAAIGISIAAGAPKRDISSVEALRQTLLAVPSIAYSRAGASGIFFEKLIDRLGIGEAVRAKSTVIPAGLTGEVVARGDAHLAVQQISELLMVDGIDFLGPMPPDVQETTNFSAAVFADAVDGAGAMRFIAALTSPQARQAFTQSGLMPLFA